MKDKEQLATIAQEVSTALYLGDMQKAVVILDKLQQWANNKGYIQGSTNRREGNGMTQNKLPKPIKVWAIVDRAGKFTLQDVCGTRERASYETGAWNDHETSKNDQTDRKHIVPMLIASVEGFMGHMGSIKTPKKSKSSAKNGKLGGRPRKRKAKPGDFTEGNYP